MTLQYPTIADCVGNTPLVRLQRLAGSRQGGQWLLWLEDEGGGVDEAQLEHIFAPFTRLDDSRPGNGGFGLGLSIARNALQRQSGQLWAQNNAKGLRVNMQLPAVI